MKTEPVVDLEQSQLMFLALCLGCGLWLAGCSGGNVEQPRAQQARELARLREENKDVPKLRAENKELSRLRKENEELPQLRKQTDEIEKMRKDNDRIRGEIADLANKARRQNQQTAQQAQSAAALARARGMNPTGAAGVTATNIADPNLAQEGDEIFIDPKFLAKILPQFDWSKLERKEPLAVKALLEQHGIVLTNYQQLISLGITNYVIQHAPTPPAAAPTVPAPP